MLSRDKNIVDADWLDVSLVVFIFNDNLGFAIWSQPWDLTGVSGISHLFTDQVGQVMRVGMESLSVPFVGGITEHETLISSTEVIHILGGVDCISNFFTLSLNVNEDSH